MQVNARDVAEEGMIMFIILSIIMLSGLLIYVLLKTPHAEERSVQIARKAVRSEKEYELSIMSISETQRSQSNKP